MSIVRLEGRFAVAAALAVLCLALPACGKKRPPALSGAQPGAATEATTPLPAEPTPSLPAEAGPDVTAVEGGAASGADLASEYAATGSIEGGPLADVRFAYDSAVLGDEARATLERHALWLQGRRDARVTIEGHCDERGTVEYNLALGEQRARAVRDYLVSLGVSADRLRPVSLGKERPLDPAPTEEAYAKNRRAHFALTR
jgi:peptidoglycan-associated lipoprotein